MLLSIIISVTHGEIDFARGEAEMSSTSEEDDDDNETDEDDGKSKKLKLHICAGSSFSTLATK